MDLYFPILKKEITENMKVTLHEPFKLPLDGRQEYYREFLIIADTMRSNISRAEGYMKTMDARLDVLLNLQTDKKFFWVSWWSYEEEVPNHDEFDEIISVHISGYGEFNDKPYSVVVCCVYGDSEDDALNNIKKAFPDTRMCTTEYVGCLNTADYGKLIGKHWRFVSEIPPPLMSERFGLSAFGYVKLWKFFEKHTNYDAKQSLDYMGLNEIYGDYIKNQDNLEKLILDYLTKKEADQD